MKIDIVNPIPTPKSITMDREAGKTMKKVVEMSQLVL
jgi:hypothetical protein